MNKISKENSEENSEENKNIKKAIQQITQIQDMIPRFYAIVSVLKSSSLKSRIEQNNEYFEALFEICEEYFTKKYNFDFKNEIPDGLLTMINNELDDLSIIKDIISSIQKGLYELDILKLSSDSPEDTDYRSIISSLDKNYQCITSEYSDYLSNGIDNLDSEFSRIGNMIFPMKLFNKHLSSLTISGKIFNSVMEYIDYRQNQDKDSKISKSLK